MANPFLQTAHDCIALAKGRIGRNNKEDNYCVIAMLDAATHILRFTIRMEQYEEAELLKAEKKIRRAKKI